MKAYLSHPISGMDAEHVRALALQRKGILTRNTPFTMVLPTEVKACQWCNSGVDQSGHDHSWQEWMRADIDVLIECDVIIMCEGWVDSPGAKMELSVALACGLRVYFLYDPTPGDPPALFDVIHGEMRALHG